MTHNYSPLNESLREFHSHENRGPHIQLLVCGTHHDQAGGGWKKKEF